MSNVLDGISEFPQRLIASEPLPTLILGGGFTGLFTALHLSRQHYTTPTILIDREWNFIFKPLLYDNTSGIFRRLYRLPCIEHHSDCYLNGCERLGSQPFDTVILRKTAQ
jgi:hypothetical protein